MQTPGDSEGQGQLASAVHGVPKSQTRLDNWRTKWRAEEVLPLGGGLYELMLLLLLLSRFTHVQLCATPQTAARQASPSLGFSRQEHWSGLLFPSPLHESEKWKWSRSAVPDPQWPHGLQPSRLLRPWDFPGKSTGVGCHCLLRTSLYWHIIKPF